MLESMIGAPVPTRAEASDVATAIYDGADAVDALGRVGQRASFRVEAVGMINSIIAQTESDPQLSRWNRRVTIPPPLAVAADAIGWAARSVAGLTRLLQAAATVAYTSSGSSAFRMARERPRAPILGMTPRLATARRLALVWGVNAGALP